MATPRFRLHFIFLFSLVFISVTVNAQSKKITIEGLVVDTAGIPLKGVSVRLIAPGGAFTQASAANGRYTFTGVPLGQIRVTYSLLGYQITDKAYSATELVTKSSLPTIILSPQSELLKEVVIVKTIPVIYKQDTVQYNMNAYNFQKRLLLEDALKQLPNIQVSRDGSVFAFGKPITSVQVEGKKFFGGDVLTATRNLPADFVKNLQIIDYYGDYNTSKGTKSGEPEKIINIVLKDDKKKIVFGQVTGGIGTEDRYLMSGGINKFNDGQELSLIGSINNTNTSLFTFGSPSGGSRERSMGELADFADPTDGLNTTTSLGGSFSDNLTKTTTVNGQYTFTKRQNLIDGNSLLQSVYSNNSIFNQEDYQVDTKDFSHRMALNFDSKFKNNDILKIEPVFSYSRTYINNYREKKLRNNVLTNDGTYSSISKNFSPNLDVDALYSKFFKKPGRKLVFNMRMSAGSSSKDEQVTDRYIIQDAMKKNNSYSFFLQRQYIETVSDNRSIKLNGSYIEPINSQSSLEVSYEFERNDIDANRRVEDLERSQLLGYMVFIDSLGLNYDYKYSSNQTAINYQYDSRDKKFKYNLGFGVQPLEISGRLYAEDEQYTYDNVNLIPTAGFKWKINDQTDFSIDYMGKNNQPNFYQIQPIRDVSNSQNIIVGNPALKAEFTNRISSRFRKSIVSKGQYFEANLSYNFVQNKIATDKISLNNTTVQQTSYQNMSGYYDIRSYYLFSSPFISDDFQLNINGNGDFYNNVSMVNKALVTNRQFIYSQSMQLRYMIDDIMESEFNGNYMLNSATYKWPFKSNITAHSFVLSLGNKFYFNEHMTLGVEVSQRFNDGYRGTAKNVNPTVINSYFECTFLPNKLAMLRLQGFDLLNQNTGISREILGNDILDIRNNRLARYFMLSLNLRLQKYPKKS
ncbi:outer membrane beta-barrel protein [Sphingobacterium spiritivorum]|uniref:outer membrane beta-barrel protein n=1 Tax=Sphingobacterium spiritivorum TaxID=258 RepID=UPI003DA2EBB1